MKRKLYDLWIPILVILISVALGVLTIGISSPEETPEPEVKNEEVLPSPLTIPTPLVIGEEPVSHKTLEYLNDNLYTKPITIKISDTDNGKDYSFTVTQGYWVIDGEDNLLYFDTMGMEKYNEVEYE